MINELKKWLFGGDEALKEVFDGIDIFLEGEWMSENEMKNTDCTEMADLLYDAEVYLDTLSRAADKDKGWLLKMRDAIKRAARIIGGEPVNDEVDALNAIRAILENRQSVFYADKYVILSLKHHADLLQSREKVGYKKGHEKGFAKGVESVILPTDEERAIIRAAREAKDGDTVTYVDGVAIVPALRFDELRETEAEFMRECGGKRSIEARLHLCESCVYDCEECDATGEDICFGECCGRDNVIGCKYYTNRFMKTECMDNMSLRNCTNCCHNKVCGVVKHRKATKANDYTPCKQWEARHDEKAL